MIFDLGDMFEAFSSFGVFKIFISQNISSFSLLFRFTCFYLIKAYFLILKIYVDLVWREEKILYINKEIFAFIENYFN